MTNEIGSEFDFNLDTVMSCKINELKGVIYDSRDYRLVSSGRCGIKQVLLNLLIQKQAVQDEFLLPAYLCPSILQPFKELGLNVIFYEVLEDLSIDTEDLLSKVTENTRVIYYINYFGMLQPDNVLNVIRNFKESGICVLEDITHNFFSNRQDLGDFLIGSLRKWGPLPHGGIVILNSGQKDYRTWNQQSNKALRISQLRSFAQQLKYFYLNGLREEEVKNLYLHLMQAADKELYSEIEIAPMDEFSLEILKRLDFNFIVKKRRENYALLFQELKDIEDIKIVLGDIENRITPLGFHILLDHKNGLREHLIKKQIYASVHWVLPEEIQNNFTRSAGISQNMLTIPCDQRYGRKDIIFIAETVKEYFLLANKYNSLQQTGGRS